jgi:hypothetical protein
VVGRDRLYMLEFGNLVKLGQMGWPQLIEMDLS